MCAMREPMPIKLPKRTEGGITEQMHEGDFRNADEVIHEGMTLLSPRANG